MPSDSLNNQTSNLASVIQQAIKNKLLDVHTSMPGFIVSYDAPSQTASVQPCIKRIFKTTGDDSKETLVAAPLPVLINVNVIFQGGGGFSQTFPIAENNECVLHFSERSIDNWHQKGGVVDPNAYRQHSLSDAFAVVGVNSEPNKIVDCSADDMEIRNVDRTQRITLKANGDIEIVTDGNINMSAANLLLTGNMGITGGLSVTEDITTPSDVVAGTVSVKLHLHPQAPDSSGDTQVPTGAPIP